FGPVLAQKFRLRKTPLSPITAEKQVGKTIIWKSAPPLSAPGLAPVEGLQVRDEREAQGQYRPRANILRQRLGAAREDRRYGRQRPAISRRHYRRPRPAYKRSAQQEARAEGGWSSHGERARRYSGQGSGHR